MSVFLCKAVSRGAGTMICHRCKLLWDIGNPDPPRCHTAAEILDDPLNPIIEKMVASHRTERKA